jgi:hypothetical protein
MPTATREGDQSDNDDEPFHEGVRDNKHRDDQ